MHAGPTLSQRTQTYNNHNVVMSYNMGHLQANLLLRNFRYCSDDVKCTLFQSYCTNMYCCQLWFNSTKSSLIKLSTSYNSVLRRLLCISKSYSASNMFISRGNSSFAEVLRKSIYRFKKTN